MRCGKADDFRDEVGKLSRRRECTLRKGDCTFGMFESSCFSFDDLDEDRLYE